MAAKKELYPSVKEVKKIVGMGNKTQPDSQEYHKNLELTIKSASVKAGLPAPSHKQILSSVFVYRHTLSSCIF